MIDPTRSNSFRKKHSALEERASKKSPRHLPPPSSPPPLLPFSSLAASVRVLPVEPRREERRVSLAADKNTPWERWLGHKNTWKCNGAADRRAKYLRVRGRGAKTRAARAREGKGTGETPTEWDVTGFTRRRGSKVVSIGAGGGGRGKRKFPRVRRQAFYYTYVYGDTSSVDKDWSMIADGGTSLGNFFDRVKLWLVSASTKKKNLELL